MTRCSFERLLKLINKQLDLDGQLEIYHHLDRCDICRDAVYQISRDRDIAFYAYPRPTWPSFPVPGWPPIPD